MKLEVKNIVMITFFSVVLGTMLSTPLKQEVEDYDMVTLSSIDSLKTEVESLKVEVDVMEKSIEDKKEKLEEKKALEGKDDATLIKSIESEIDSIKQISGVHPVEGPGIRLLIADNASEEIVGQNINDDIIHDSDIQTILNDLKRAGAEAISINGQRVVSKSEVKCGGPVIKINKRSSANPFVISVIGDPKSLVASVEGKGTYGDMLKNVYKIKVEVEEKEKVFIPGYEFEDFRYLYAQSKKEEESN
ncbi:hypothetical protein EUAN_08110 [Andreesenia angusta]|uniref:Division initiation protein n=1 Tax=Andreesenia angusta TaxID=39480 RepID=A0A1S1VA71_9FIRM|nr:DUF881 domain-containing protein [Andreesenia angusta]OHW63027.1 hypothetical protein EUAN_08110 [Andreesenia angusta]